MQANKCHKCYLLKKQFKTKQFIEHSLANIFRKNPNNCTDILATSDSCPLIDSIALSYFYDAHSGKKEIHVNNLGDKEWE